MFGCHLEGILSPNTNIGDNEKDSVLLSKTKMKFEKIKVVFALLRSKMTLSFFLAYFYFWLILAF